MLKCCKTDLFVILWLALKIVMDFATIVVLYRIWEEVGWFVLCWIPFKVSMDIFTFIVLVKRSFNFPERPI